MDSNRLVLVPGSHEPWSQAMVDACPYMKHLLTATAGMFEPQQPPKLPVSDQTGRYRRSGMPSTAN